jgi:hypothetical protein
MLTLQLYDPADNPFRRRGYAAEYCNSVFESFIFPASCAPQPNTIVTPVTSLTDIDNELQRIGGQGQRIDVLMVHSHGLPGAGLDPEISPDVVSRYHQRTCTRPGVPARHGGTSQGYLSGMQHRRGAAGRGISPGSRSPHARSGRRGDARRDIGDFFCSRVFRPAGCPVGQYAAGNGQSGGCRGRQHHRRHCISAA